MAVHELWSNSPRQNGLWTNGNRRRRPTWPWKTVLRVDFLKFAWICLLCLSVLSKFSVDHTWIILNQCKWTFGEVNFGNSKICAILMALGSKNWNETDLAIEGQLVSVEFWRTCWVFDFLRSKFIGIWSVRSSNFGVQKSSINPIHPWQVDSFNSLPYISEDPGRWEFSVHARSDKSCSFFVVLLG